MHACLVCSITAWLDVWPTDIWPTDVWPTGHFTDRHLADKTFHGHDEISFLRECLQVMTLSVFVRQRAVKTKDKGALIR